MTKSQIYTKGGDSGETSLVSGKRVLKSHLSIQVYGEVDELNSAIGYLASFSEQSLNKELLEAVQSELFNLGSNLATEPENRQKYKIPKVSDSIVQKLEKSIDEMDSKLEKLTNFILPGGHQVSSWSHMCRTICRRVERSLVEVEQGGDKISNALEFINRLSDFFFVQARFVNKAHGTSEVLWKPSKD